MGNLTQAKEIIGNPDGFGGESNEFDAELLKAYYGELV